METDTGFHSHLRLRCILTILLLIGCIPLSIIYITLVLFLSFPTGLSKNRRPINKQSKTVMITGGKMSKSLQFARWFWKSGYKVIMIESEKYCYVGSRWSRAVTYFETVACPRINSKKYVNDLVRIAEKYNANYFVPVSSPVSALHDSPITQLPYSVILIVFTTALLPRYPTTRLPSTSYPLDITCHTTTYYSHYPLPTT